MGKDRLLTRTFVLAAAVNFLHSLSFLAYLHVPGFIQGLGAGPFMVGIVVGTMAAAAILARPWVGRAMDTRGRRVVALAGGVVHVGACLAYLLVTEVGPWLFAVRVVHGVAEAMLFSVMFTIAADVIPESRRAEGMALFGISGMLPMAVGGLLGDYVLSVAGYDVFFMATAAAAAAGLVLSVPIVESRPANRVGAAARSFLVAATAPVLRPLWWATFVFSILIASYFTFLKLFVEAAGVGSVGTFFAAYSAAAIALRLFLGWVPDRLGLRRTLVPSIWVAAAGVWLLSGYGSTQELIVAGVLCGAGHGYAFPVISALVVARAPAAERGSALAAFTALFDVGLVAGGPTLGAVVDLAGYPVMFATAAMCAFAGTFVFVAWDRNNPG